MAINLENSLWENIKNNKGKKKKNKIQILLNLKSKNLLKKKLEKLNRSLPLHLISNLSPWKILWGYAM